MWLKLANSKGTFIKVILGRAIAQVLETLGAEEQALCWVSRSIKWVPEQTQIHLQATRLCLKRGRVDQAMWHWKKAVGEEQSMASLLYWLKRTNHTPDPPAYPDFSADKVTSNVYSSFYKKPWILWFKKLVFKKQTVLPSLNEVGLCLLEMGKTKEALAIFQQQKTHGKLNSCALLFNMSLALSKMGYHQKALGYYQLLQAKGMNTVDLLNNKGYSLYYLERYEEAILCYELAKEMSSGNELLLANLAACYQRVKAYPQAVNNYTIALQCAANNSVTLNNYACCLEELGRFEEALELYNQALVISPGNKVFLLNKAVCLFILRRYQDSIVICDQILSQEPYCFEAWGLRGNLLNIAGQTKEAATCYSRALGLAC